MAALPSTVAASTMTPSFATVTLVFAADSTNTTSSLPPTGAATTVSLEPKTMRVPITPQTTIRELAKGAMARFLCSLRRTAASADVVARQLCRTGIVATDIHLLSPSDSTTAPHAESANRSTTIDSNTERRSGATPQQRCKIELFSDDRVLQVVQVREEIIYMRFKAAAASARAKERQVNTEAETAVLEDAMAVGKGTADVSSPASPVLPPSWNVLPTDQSITTGLTTDDDVICDCREELSKGDISMSVPVPQQESTVRITSIITKKCATVAVERHHTPVLPQRGRSVSPSTATETSSHSSSSDSEDDAEVEARRNIARSIETLRQAETRRMPWGPDAYKHFATNYVNSPQKIMTGRYNYKRQRPAPSVKLHESPCAQKPGKTTTAAATVGAGDRDDSTQMRCRTEERRSNEDSQVSVQMYSGASSPSMTSDIRAASNRFNSPSLSAPAPTCAEGDLAGAVVPRLTAEETCSPRVKDSDGGFAVSSNATDTYASHGEAMMTPAEAIMARQTSLAAPSTVAKPVQGFVARQLSYEEESAERLSKPPTQLSSPVEESGLVVPVLRVQRIEPCA